MCFAPVEASRVCLRYEVAGLARVQGGRRGQAEFLRIELRIGGWNRWEGNAANDFHGEIAGVRVCRGMLNGERAARPAPEP